MTRQQTQNRIVHKMNYPNNTLLTLYDIKSDWADTVLNSMFLILFGTFALGVSMSADNLARVSY